MKTEYFYLPIEDIGQSWSELRIIAPGAEAAMERSMRQFGQMAPVVVCRFENGEYELADGFKRLRAAIRLEYERLCVRIFPGGIRAAKAAMICLNMKARSICDFEKSLVIRSLHRHDGLTQAQIAKLLDRHPSWVCRKLSLAERLCEEVTEYLRLGLINMTVGRELAKLPRGNQEKAVKTVIAHNLTSDETARFVAMLTKDPRRNHESIPDFSGVMPGNPSSKSKRPSFLDRLVKLRIWADEVPESEIRAMSSVQRNLLVGAMDHIEEMFAHVRKQIKGEE